MADPTGLVVRVLHVVFGVCWAGAAILLALVIEPAISRMGPDGGRFMKQLMEKGRFGVYMMATGLGALLSGAILLWTASAGHPGAWMGSGYGRAILLGSAAGFLGLLWGVTVNSPTAIRLSRLAGEIQKAGGPPADGRLQEMARLKARLHVGGIMTAVLLGTSAVLMAAARQF